MGQIVNMPDNKNKPIISLLRIYYRISLDFKGHLYKVEKAGDAEPSPFFFDSLETKLDKNNGDSREYRITLGRLRIPDRDEYNLCYTPYSSQDDEVDGSNFLSRLKLFNKKVLREKPPGLEQVIFWNHSKSGKYSLLLAESIIETLRYGAREHGLISYVSLPKGLESCILSVPLREIRKEIKSPPPLYSS